MKKNTNLLTTHLVKGFVCLLIYMISAVSVFSQNAGISPSGAVAPNAAAALDVNFTNKGLLIPRVALASTTSPAPLTAHVNGMLIYNTATISDVNPGLYYNNGSKWIPVFPKANTAGEMQYWDGTVWKTITAGSPGQRLQINGSGVPAWAP